ncbi:TPA: CRISPR-associated protein Cas4 [Candidatus Sumerlaeota bacterium]|nr:CRISPR-associated protein Cas4 [Candidatus Sumerlaeota bacterium]
MTYTEENLLPISALQHLLFCERQCALIHIEQVWAENRLTMEGRVLHEKTHAGDGEIELRDGVRISRGLRLRSFRLGLIGIADVVEFYALDSPPGAWRPYPVEYKRGRPKPDACDLMQLCAQAICLEEMTGRAVPEGAIFYGQPRRRMEVQIDAALREQTESLCVRLRALVDAGRTPPAHYEKKCEACSLLELCMPKAAQGKQSAAEYVHHIWEAAE